MTGEKFERAWRLTAKIRDLESRLDEIKAGPVKQVVFTVKGTFEHHHYPSEECGEVVKRICVAHVEGQLCQLKRELEAL